MSSTKFPFLGVTFDGLTCDNDPYVYAGETTRAADLFASVASSSTKSVLLAAKLTPDEVAAIQARILAHLQAAENELASLHTA